MIVTEKQRRYYEQLSKDRLGRGPVEALDPHKLYEEQRLHLRNNTSGVGKLVFEYIPFSLIKSFALAIDPYKKFKVAPVKVSPVHRTRYKHSSNVFQKRSFTRRVKYESTYTYNYVPGDLFCYSPPVIYESGTNVDIFDLPDQEDIPSYIKDTTIKGRDPDSVLGELELFKFQIHSPGRTIYRHDFGRTDLAVGHCYPQSSGAKHWYTNSSNGPGARIVRTHIDAITADEKSRLNTIMGTRIPGMLAKTVPTGRRMTIFRSVAELKDLPRSVSTLMHTMQNFRSLISILPRGTQEAIFRSTKKSASDIPKEYLSYHFGWKQMIKDLFDLLEAPIRVAKEVNRLQRRSGQPTTFRSISRFAGETSSSPDFYYDTDFPEEIFKSQTNRLERNHELRLVINATFDFPKVNIPQFKKELFLSKLGVYPTITDFYNLTPWSWLLDWFTGFGNYIEAIDAINSDPSLINWGMVTGITNGTLTCTRNSVVKNSDWHRQLYDDAKGEDHIVPYAHTSILEFKYQIRQNLSKSFGVKTIAESGSLTLYQQSILAAILASRNHRGGR